MDGYHMSTLLAFILNAYCNVCISAYYRLYDFDSNQAAMIVQEHNRLRALETASDMQALVWDPNLALVAKDWASRCAAMHRPGVQRTNVAGFGVIGENIWWSNEAYLRGDLASIIKDFYDEKPFFSFSSNWCQPGEMCGHYTQVVWSTSCAVGCAASYCDYIYDGRGIVSGHMIVCNYGPGGNYVGQHPYTYGATCASCPGRCVNGLCASTCTGQSVPPPQPAPLPPVEIPVPVPVPPKIVKPEPLKTAIIGNGCTDQHANCESWSTKGECDKNKVFMDSYCKTSCKTPCAAPAPPPSDPVCVDRENLCTFWASLGECNTNAVWMNNNCYQSCHRTECTNPPTVMKSNCIDKHQYCSFWASLNECTTNTFYMKWKCPKTCSLC